MCVCEGVCVRACMCVYKVGACVGLTFSFDFHEIISASHSCCTLETRGVTKTGMLLLSSKDLTFQQSLRKSPGKPLR